MTTQTDPLANTQTALRHILGGHAPNGIKPADCSHPDIISEVYKAHGEGGTEAARRVIVAATAKDSSLAQLISGPDLVPNTPSTFDKNQPLDVDTVKKALDQGEIGDAALLAKLYKGRLAYDHAEKQWYLWNGHHWEPDCRKQVVNLIDKVAAQYLEAAAVFRAKSGDVEAQIRAMEMAKRAGGLRFRNKIHNVLTLAVSHPDLALSGDEWERDPMLLGVANGVIELKTGILRPGQPDDYIRTVAPTVWRGIDAPAPRWEQFLQEIFAGDKSLIDFVQRLLGYGIINQVVQHVIPIFWGHGRNGKDTLLEAIKHTLGPSVGPASKDVLMEKRMGSAGAASPHLYDLRHRRIAWVSETSAGARLNAEQTKYLTGGGMIKARPLYGNEIEFSPKFLMILLTNHKPRADADDYALWKRLLLIPFTQSFVDDPKEVNEHKADPHLLEKLKAEAPGILAWLVRGCLSWQKQGLNPPDIVKLATDEYQQEEDDLAQFIEECCITGPSYRVEAGPLYKAYERWGESYGKRPWGSRKFGEKFAKRFQRKRTNDGNIYFGIGLLQNQSV